MECMFWPFKLLTCSSLLIKRGHSTWFCKYSHSHGRVTHSIYFVIPLHVTIDLVTYGLGVQLNINSIFNVDKVSYSVKQFVSEFHALYMGNNEVW